MVCALLRISLGEIDAQISLGNLGQEIYAISARQSDFVIVTKNGEKKENMPRSGLYCPCRPQSKIERKWKET